MRYRYEVVWDSEIDDPQNEGEKFKYTQDFFDIADARQCMLLHSKRNAVMKVRTYNENNNL